MLPPTWRTHTGVNQVAVEAANVRDLTRGLSDRYPHLESWLFEPDGALKHWINVFVNGQDIRLLQEADTPLRPEDEVRIILAIAGG